MRRISPVLFGVVASLFALVATVLLVRGHTPIPHRPLAATMADLQAVHAGVAVGGTEVRRVRRLAKGDAVETDADGHARLRLDDGTALVVDRDTRLTLTPTGVVLERGRIFVQGAAGALTTIELGAVTALIHGANAAVARPRDAGAKATIYSATGELTVRTAGVDHPVQTGETASIAGPNVTVAPERGFDDWTGGLATPWGAHGAPRRAVGELWGRSGQPGDAGSPLTIRAHDVHATVTGEVAETATRTTFFNAGSDNVTGDYRMALPPFAIVSRFAVVRGEATLEGRVALADRGQVTPFGAPVRGSSVLEWAGEGWVRATVPSIAPGTTVAILVDYVEWLTPRPNGDGPTLVVQYRYPMASDAIPPLIGEFSAHVDASPSGPLSIASGLGARVDGHAIELRRPDFRPTADLVVDVEIEPWMAAEESATTGGAVSATPPGNALARLYVAPAPDGDDGGSVIVVRTEAPMASAAKAASGVTLALVIDTSASIEPALLDAERALVEAVLENLGPKDRAVVLAADQTAYAVGPALGPVDAARRKAVSEGLAALSPGGATDLGRALEAGADALPADAPAAMVIYMGDGWPTMGDPGVEAIRARLARRTGGPPRLGAVAVGPLANRLALAALTRGSGPLVEVADSADAARAAVELCADALQPTAAGVEIVFGPEVERVYPRGPRAIAAGGSVMAVGRVRGALPKQITLHYRDAAGPHEERRTIVAERAGNVNGGDVARRWATARVEEIALRNGGREAATDVALRAGLLTPWTGWLTGGRKSYVASALESRVLDLATGDEGGFSAAFVTPTGTLGALTGVVHDTEVDPADDSADAFKAALISAARRAIMDAGSAVRACRDSRAALRPELAGNLAVDLQIDGDGHASSVIVHADLSADDAGLVRCIEGVIEAVAFPASGLTVKIAVHTTLALPPPRATLGARKCSPTSTLPLPLRRGIWHERQARTPPASVYVQAKESCELPTWADRRALLELILLDREDGVGRLEIATQLDAVGETDAATLIRREAVRRARSPSELHAIRSVLVAGEHYPTGTFKKQYEAATDDTGRLAVVRRFLGIAPHDARLRRRLLALLEAQGKKSELIEEVARARRDPFADAGLLADGASALRRAGDEREARRAFGELAERAPADPWARAFLGDRLRNEGWFDDATRAYAVLEELIPDDPAAVVRLALAHAGAGRLDIASRMLARVAATGGRSGDARFGQLAARLAQDLIAGARATPGISAGDDERLARTALELPFPGGATVILVRTPAGTSPIEVTLVRGPKDARGGADEVAPDVAADGIGLYALRIDPPQAGAPADVVLRLKRRAELAPARPTKVLIDALIPEGQGKSPRLVTTELELPITGKATEMRWTGSGWSAR